jgi:hypothetical protein
MGGSSNKKESELTIWNRVYNIGYGVLDFVSIGALSSRDTRISKLERDLASSAEREVTRANRVVSINAAHEIEKRDWAKKVGLVEAENERLEFKLGGAYKELKEVRAAYERVQEIIAVNDGIEGAMLELEEFHRRSGLYVPNAEKNALDLIRRQRAFVRMAYEEVEEARRGNVLGRTHVKMEKKEVMFVLDEKHRVEAMSKAAIKLVGEDVTGKSVDYVSSTLGIMLGYVAPTYEEEFSATLGSVGDSKDVRVNVGVERYFGQHIGASVVVEPKSWFRREARREGAYLLVADRFFDDGGELTKMVSAAVDINYGRNPIGMDLRATREISDEVARRIGGLAQSKYFRNRMKMVVTNEKVYNHLRRFDVPEELIIDSFDRGEAVGEVVPVIS